MQSAMPTDGQQKTLDFIYGADFKCPRPFVLRRTHWRWSGGQPFPTHDRKRTLRELRGCTVNLAALWGPLKFTNFIRVVRILLREGLEGGRPPQQGIWGAGARIRRGAWGSAPPSRGPRLNVRDLFENCEIAQPSPPFRTNALACKRNPNLLCPPKWP